MKRNTKIDLILESGDKSESEVFRNFQGIIPRVGEYVSFYKKLHDGVQYHGMVLSVEHRIEYVSQNDKTKNSEQTIRVVIEYTEE